VRRSEVNTAEQAVSLFPDSNPPPPKTLLHFMLFAILSLTEEFNGQKRFSLSARPLGGRSGSVLAIV